jgi:hypothetical protein
MGLVTTLITRGWLYALRHVGARRHRAALSGALVMALFLVSAPCR